MEDSDSGDDSPLGEHRPFFIKYIICICLRR